MRVLQPFILAAVSALSIAAAPDKKKFDASLPANKLDPSEVKKCKELEINDREEGFRDSVPPAKMQEMGACDVLKLRYDPPKFPSGFKKKDKTGHGAIYFKLYKAAFDRGEEKELVEIAKGLCPKGENPFAPLKPKKAGIEMTVAGPCLELWNESVSFRWQQEEICLRDTWGNLEGKVTVERIESAIQKACPTPNKELL